MEAKQRVDWEKHYNHLSLACTCHHIYREVINLLYSCNHFMTKDPYAVCDLVMYCLQPQPYHAIRILKLPWSLTFPISYNPLAWDEPYAGAAWLHCFPTVTAKLELSSLKINLKIPICDHWPRNDLRTDAPWLQSLLMVANITKLGIILKVAPRGPLDCSKDGGQMTTLEGFQKDMVVVLTEKGHQVTSGIHAISCLRHVPGQ